MFTLLDLCHLLCIFSPILRTFLSVYTHTHFALHFQRAQLLLSELEIWKNVLSTFRCYCCCCRWCCLKCLSICNCQFTIFFLLFAGGGEVGVAHAKRRDAAALGTCNLTLGIVVSYWSRFCIFEMFFFFVFIYIYGLRKLWAQSAWTWPRLWLRAELQKPATTTIVVQFIFI